MDVETIALDEGSTHCFVKQEGNKLLFVKEFFPLGYKVGKKTFRILQAVDNRILKQINPFYHHRIFPKTNLAYLDKEIKTWQLWKEQGIQTLELERIEKWIIFWEYLKSQSLNQALNQKDSPQLFDQFIEVYDSIRSLAKRKQETNYLHSDPHLKNFLVSENDYIIPIDSGCLINKKLSFPEIDFRLMNQTLCSILLLQTSNEAKTGYIKQFKSMLSPEEIEKFITFNPNMGSSGKIYLKLREEVAYKVKGRDKKDVLQPVNHIEKLYNQYVKKIFAE